MTTSSLYHCFPRPMRKSVAEVNKQGIEILRNTLEVGLVLAPELVTWNHQDGEPTIFLQRRMCFTELSESELPDHAKVFGPFALRFSMEKLRAAGAMPVIYVPQSLPGHPGSGIAEFCVKAACHTKYVLERLYELKNLADDMASGTYNGFPVDKNASITLSNHKPERVRVNEFNLKPSDISNLMTYINFRNIPFDHSIAMLEIFENMFYPTDNSHSDENLGYYRQREWRLVQSALQINGKSTFRNLTDDEGNKLEIINSHFWQKKISINGQTFKRSKLASIYQPYGNPKIHDLIECIVVPSKEKDSISEFYNGKIEVID